MTPFLSPDSEAERKYNEAQIATRTRIEHTFGVVKNRSGCLLIPLRVMGPKRSCSVITACLVLHNIGVMSRDLFQPLPPGVDNQGTDPTGDNTNEAGQQKRQSFVREYFS